uniref:Uncharacterized protein n=1 Tax=Cacopsylla melanoneura TaxID=428564 RepID=A0A8D8MA57_9HEMI
MSTIISSIGVIIIIRLMSFQSSTWILKEPFISGRSFQCVVTFSTQLRSSCLLHGDRPNWNFSMFVKQHNIDCHIFSEGWLIEARYLRCFQCYHRERTSTTGFQGTFCIHWPSMFVVDFLACNLWIFLIIARITFIVTFSPSFLLYAFTKCFRNRMGNFRSCTCFGVIVLVIIVFLAASRFILAFILWSSLRSCFTLPSLLDFTSLLVVFFIFNFFIFVFNLVNTFTDTSFSSIGSLFSSLCRSLQCFSSGFGGCS